MHTDPNWSFFRALLAARLERIHGVKDDRGAFSIEMMMLVAGLVVVGGVVAAVILAKVNEKKNLIK
ncbi:hypothetical protein [Streptomyces chryseus]